MFEFLDACAPLLNQIRTEVQVKKELGGWNELESSAELESENGGKKQFRQPSPTVIALLHRFFPQLREKGAEITDSETVIAMVINNMKLWDQTDLPLFELRLQQLSELVAALHPVAASRAYVYCSLCRAFKQLYVRERGEDPMAREPAKSPRIFAVRKWLRNDKQTTAAQMAHNEARLAEKLRDVFVESYPELERKILEMRDCRPQGKAESVELLIAAICASHARKGEIIDPSIQFMTYRQWREAYEDPLKRMVLGDPEEDGVEIRSAEKFDSTIGLEYVIVQIGCAKDRAQAINQFVTKDDSRYVPQKILVKPCVFMTAEDTVNCIRKFREINNLTVENFKTRAKESNKWNTQVVLPLLQRFVPRSCALAKQRGWPMGTHFCRKLAAAVSYEIFNEKVRAMTHRFIDRSVWVSSVLGHSGDSSLSVSLNYSNVHVDFPVPYDCFKSFPGFSTLLAEMDMLKERIAALETDTWRDSFLKNNAAMEVAFVNKAGEVVFLPKHQKRKYNSQEDSNAEVAKAFDMLKDKQVHTTVTNVMRMGFGKDTIQAYTHQHKDTETKKRNRFQ